MREYWISWAKAAGVRAVKTFAQTAVATVGTAAAIGDVDWRMVASAAALAAVLSLLTSVAGLPEVKADEWPLDDDFDDDGGEWMDDDARG